MRKENKKDTINNKIMESKKIIEEAKKTIKLEKKAIRKKKRERLKNSQFGKSKFGKFLLKIFFIFSDKDKYSFSELFVMTIISLILGFSACFSVLMILAGGRNSFKMVKDLGKFYDVYNVLIENYNGNLKKDDLIEKAIDGMVSSVGDVYTNYGDSNAASAFDELVTGTYEGIGCTIQQMENKVIIVDVYDDSPAYKAGLKTGDVIKTVDDIVASEVGVNKVADYVKNEANGEIKLIAIRDEKEIEFTLKRAKVEVPNVVSKTFDKNGKKIGYIKISLFSSVANKQFEKQLLKLEEDGIESLVIDVRDNNGGYLTTVTDIANYLLPKGEVIYQVQDNNKKRKVTKDKTATKRDYPIAILTNNGSASASEILAAVIKESYNGYVVGEKTYGKGTVQQVRKLKDGSMIKYTVENWLTPDGNWINNVGITPTDEIILTEEYFKNPSDESDNQLQKALELVSK